MYIDSSKPDDEVALPELGIFHTISRAYNSEFMKKNVCTNSLQTIEEIHLFYNYHDLQIDIFVSTRKTMQPVYFVVYLLHVHLHMMHYSA